MAKKFYAVYRGKETGVFTTWEECRVQVEGVPSARYKSFPSKEEAEQFARTGKYEGAVKGTLQKAGSKGSKTEQQTKSEMGAKPFIKPTAGEMIAYVDGSYHSVTCEFSYGVVAFYEDKEEHLSLKMSDVELASMRNVAGEIKGAQAAMQLALEKRCNRLTIYHDYEGIAKWPLGQWKANKEGTIAYRNYYDGIKEQLKVTFQKVKGHSNDFYNDLADSLAKEALGIS